MKQVLIIVLVWNLFLTIGICGAYNRTSALLGLQGEVIKVMYDEATVTSKIIAILQSKGIIHETRN